MGRYITNANTNSYQDNELLRLKQGFAKNHKEFSSAGTTTWTIDHDVIARVRVWGGGGGGGGATGTRPSGGGGAGGAAEAILRLNAGTYNITVGSGGAGGKGSSTNFTGGLSGVSGGSSSFHTYITCTGGSGGDGGHSELVRGGFGGSVTFSLNNFDGFLYVDGRPGGAGGSFVIELYTKDTSASGGTPYRVYRGSERGEGESGGPASYTVLGSGDSGSAQCGGGGGGGYNHPFIYGPGRGVGTGGNGGRAITSGDGSTSTGAGGAPGAVIIEWN